MKNQKGFVLPILIIISILILVVIAYFFSPKSISLTLPTPTPTSVADWKTYTDTNHFTDFKYPVTYRGSEIKIISNTKYLAIGMGLDTGLIEVTSEVSNVPLKDWWSKQTENLSRVKLADYRESIFSEQKSVEVTFDKSETEFSEYKIILVANNGRNYAILAYHSASKCTDYSDCWEKELEGQILSTFRFTN